LLALGIDVECDWKTLHILNIKHETLIYIG
jgi:hypothetical protein